MNLKENKKILFIAYQFPPQAGAGVHRSLQFVKYLPQHGYTPIVLTIKKNHIQKTGSKIDHTLCDQIPKSTKIVRVNDGRPMKLIHFLQKLRIFRVFWFLFFPIFWEYSALWPFYAYSTAARIIKEENINLIYTSSGPFSPLFLAFLLKFRFKLNWVADLRDPFTDAYFWKFPSKLHWYFIRIFFEKPLFRNADLLIVNTPAVKKLYLKRNLSKKGQIKVITNGY